MVHAELSYNPYLLETEVLFNGEPPRINSLVEKYQGRPLQEWIAKVPSIFYNEMNGYDFELDFTGTTLDFEELKATFLQAGVGSDLVSLFHKGILGGRNEKVIAIDELLEWLKAERNRNFDADAFFEKNKELLEGAYSLVTIGGSLPNTALFDDMDIAIENVDSVDELCRADLKSTLILFYLDRKTLPMLSYNLGKLLSRSDVTQEQVYFRVDPSCGERVIRIIRDLGVRDPQIVGSVTDPKIHRYYEICPVTEYIYDVIKALREQTNELDHRLTIATRQSEITNNDIHYKIRDLENVLIRLKAAHERFLNKNALDMSPKLIAEKDKLLTAISQWRIKKIKINDIDEAELRSKELLSYMCKLSISYRNTVLQLYDSVCEEVADTLKDIYQEAKYRPDDIPKLCHPVFLCEYHIPDITSALMATKDEHYVTPKEDLFGKIFKAGQDAQPQGPVLETTFYLEKWRKLALDKVDPIVTEVTNKMHEMVCKYYDELAVKYAEHTNSLIAMVIKEKDALSAQLSVDEQLLEADKNWLAALCDKLYRIERS